MAAARHASDGGGSVTLVLPEGDDGSAHAGSKRSWTFHFSVGPEGIQDGGALYFQTSAFWGWSTPQAIRPREPGFTTIAQLDRPEHDPLQVQPQTLGPNLMAFLFSGRALAEGETFEIVFGATEALARADRHAERGATLWFAVDGDGDGIRELLADCPTVDIHAGPPSHLVLTIPSVLRPDEPPLLTAAVLDATASSGCTFEGALEVRLVSGDEERRHTIVFSEDCLGRTSTTLPPLAPGVWRAYGVIEINNTSLVATSNPLLVDASTQRIRWGDLHGHSQLTDGTGTPDDFYTYAREVAALDFCALTDHDHWGMRFVDAHPKVWQNLQDTTNAHNDPGHFVTIVGYEWTSWIHGHRHVLSFTDSAQLHSSLDPETDDPAELWAALRGTDSLTLAHHSAGGPIATNWNFPPDPILEPVTEVMSVHGSSEALDCPALIYSPLAGNFVRDVLDRGHTLGFLASGDGHDGHPGLPHLSPYYGFRPAGPIYPRRLGNGGLAAVMSADLTRPALLNALRSRSTYATSGPRTILLADLAGHAMGQILTPQASADLSLTIHAAAPITRVELIRSGAIVQVHAPLQPPDDLSHTFHLTDLEPGEYLYLRIQQLDGGLTWSSPWFVRS
jgi:hypothetical protein